LRLDMSLRKLGVTQPDLAHGLNRLIERTVAETVGLGADLHATECRFDSGRRRGTGYHLRRGNELTKISSAKHNASHDSTAGGLITGLYTFNSQPFRNAGLTYLFASALFVKRRFLLS